MLLNLVLIPALAWSEPPSTPARGVDDAGDESLVLAERIQNVYTRVGDVRAEFAQTYIDKLRGQRPTERGVLWAKSDGRVRWSYREPVRKDFVFTGTNAYFYEPNNAQVTVFDNFETSPLANAIRFLWGQGSILETFNVSPCTERCEESPAGYTSLLLRPKNPIAVVEAIQLSVDSKTARVKRSIVFDPLGNKTQYVFDAIRFGEAVEDKKFVFKIPEGVSIIRATP